MTCLRTRAHGITTCLLLLTVTMTTVVSEDSTVLVLDPPEKIAIEVSKSGEVSCSLPDGANQTDTVMWLNENGTNVNDLNRTQIKEDQGTLKLEGLVLSDSGDFVCTTKSRAYNSTVNVTVYNMPSYFTEGMIIIGINIGLVVIFIGCFTHRFIQTKRDKAKARKTNRRA